MVTSLTQVGAREDLLDVIQLNGAEDTPLLAGAKKTKASNVLHEWQEDELAAANKDNALIEGADYDFSTTLTRARKSNRVQDFVKYAKVSKRVMAQDLAGATDEMAYQIKKASMEIGRDIDAAGIDGETQTGDGSTLADKCNGIIAMTASANKDTYASTGILYADINGAAQLVREAGAKPNTILANGTLKASISSMTSPVTKYKEMGDRISAAVNVIETDFGILTIKLDLQMPADTVVVYDDSMVEVAELRPSEISESKNIGSYVAKAIEMELTWVLRHSKACAVLTKGS